LQAKGAGRQSALSIAFAALDESQSQSARELLTRHVWKRNWSEDLAQSYFAWRYTSRPAGETLVALDAGRCIAIVDTFLRPYRIAGRRRMVRETCDWFCLPEYRPLGIGLHLMRQVMAKPEPAIAVGGSEHTQELLPKLRWASLPAVYDFVFPASAKTVVSFLARASGRFAWVAGLVPNIPLVRRHPRSSPPFDRLLVQVRLVGDLDSCPGTGPYDFGPEVELPVLDWLLRAPPILGEFVVLRFLADDVHVGVAICRIEKLSLGCIAQVIHLQPALLEVINWMVSETVRYLLDRGAGVIFGRSSCPFISGALAAAGFYRQKPQPVFWWTRDSLSPIGPFNLASLQADDALHFRSR
jgi:hypothetical protein